MDFFFYFVQPAGKKWIEYSIHTIEVAILSTEILHSDSGDCLLSEYTDQWLHPLGANADQENISNKSIWQKSVRKSTSVKRERSYTHQNLPVSAELTKIRSNYGQLKHLICL